MKQPMLASKIKVGRILAAHGLRGEVKLQSFTSQTQDLFTFHPIVLGDVQIAVLPPFKKTKRPDVFIVPLGKTREEAEALVGQCLWVCPSQLPKLAAEEFYYAELLDRPVYGHEGDLEGHVLNVHNFGAGDILEIQEVSSKDTILVAFRAPFVAHVLEDRIQLGPRMPEC